MMSTRQIQQNKKDFVIHDFEKGLDHTLKAIEKELSERNIELIKKYQRKTLKNKKCEHKDIVDFH